MGFAYYKKCTIQTGQVPSSQSSFPALMPFLAADNDFRTTANGGFATSSSGFDIRPFSDQYLNNALTFELVTNSYSATAGSFEMWVNMTAVDGGVVYMAVGDPTVTTDGSSTSTWDSNFLAVYHLGTSTTLALTDSTSNGETLTNTNSATAASGKIGGAVSCVSATPSYLVKSAAISLPSAATLTCWVNPTTLPSTYNAPAGLIASASASYFIEYVRSTNHGAYYTVGANAGGTQVAKDPGSINIATSTWSHEAMTYDSTNGLATYVNASSDGTTAAQGNILTATVDILIGHDSNTAGQDWNGLVDEVHFSKIARSANWITTEYNNQNAPGTFWGKGTITPNMFGAITS